MNGDGPVQANAEAATEFRRRYGSHAEFSHFSPLLNPDLASQPETSIQSSGYVLHTLLASIWCLLQNCKASPFRASRRACIASRQIKRLKSPWTLTVLWLQLRYPWSHGIFARRIKSKAG
jgi:hypothetical protein